MSYFLVVAMVVALIIAFLFRRSITLNWRFYGSISLISFLTFVLDLSEGEWRWGLAALAAAVISFALFVRAKRKPLTRRDT